LNDYKPDIKHEISGSNKYKNKALQRGANGTNGQSTQKPPKLEYFSATLDPKRVMSILDAVFRDADLDTAKTYRVLQTQNRVQSEFHVTLMHRASASQHKDYWEQLTEAHTTAASKPNAAPEPVLGSCKVLLERLVWDGRLMCFVVRLVPDEKDQSGMQWRSVNETAHITVGTVSPDIKPKESNDLLKRWLQSGSGGSTGIGEITVKGHVELPATIKSVLQKH
ncbi:tRNA ligase-like protein, partial [Aureobasidium melanogenum]